MIPHTFVVWITWVADVQHLSLYAYVLSHISFVSTSLSIINTLTYINVCVRCTCIYITRSRSVCQDRMLRQLQVACWKRWVHYSPSLLSCIPLPPFSLAFLSLPASLDLLFLLLITHIYIYIYILIKGSHDVIQIASTSCADKSKWNMYISMHAFMCGCMHVRMHACKSGC